jgi:hydroxymethylpyrimidine/phosphomethylpyrimidine kinase
MKVALSIAGSDSGAGAGIQADIKTFSALGVYGCTAITAITAQNTRAVSGIFALPQGMIKGQILSVLRDFSPNAIKIGMVYSTETIRTVAGLLAKSKLPIVLDPILSAGTGARLLREDAIDTFLSKLFPLSEIVTPNRFEAEILSGIKITSGADAAQAARRLMKKGARNVIVKGGHFNNREVIDILVDSKSKVTKFTNPRIDLEESHGSGCNFSAAVASFLAIGMSLEESCRQANAYVHDAIENAVKIGKGLPVTNPLSAIYKDAMKLRVIEDLQKAVEEISKLSRFHLLIPETQTNFAYALPDASSISDVAGVRGRIVKIGNSAVPASYIEFGASKHVASAVLSYMTHQPSVRAAINIRHDERLVRLCKTTFETSSYDRTEEPAKIKRKEGATVSWGTGAALARNPRAEVIYHEGDIGKEPMINVFGRTPSEVVGKIKRILKNYQ